jgi:hypothetical protein
MENLKCKICGKVFQHLGSHLFHGHGVTAREYKEEYGLPYNMALISDEVYRKKSEAFNERREEYLKNLTKSGKKYQFKKGADGHRRISEYEKKRYVARILDVNKRKKKMEACLVCKMTFNHMESHLYNKHGLLKAPA